MCLIIQKPAGKTVDKWVLESALNYNQDGFGLMYHDNNGPVVKKWKQLGIKRINKLVKALTDVELAIHFRMATHGKVDKSNAHPFPLANGAHMMHNGILSAYAPADRDGKLSDTQIFVNTYLNKMVELGPIDVPALEQEIQGNALAILDSDGDMRLYGKGRWVEHYGLKFSNTYAWDAPSTYKPRSTLSDYAYDWRDSDNLVGDDTDVDKYMLDELYCIVDSLPLEDCDMYSAADMMLQDDLMSGNITEWDIIEYCTAETLTNLYKYAARHNLV